MKLRKIKHLMNNKGETKGYDIVVTIGNKEYCSWWTSPPKERLICHLQYLRERYPIITTQKRLEKFKELWVEMWKEGVE